MKAKRRTVAGVAQLRARVMDLSTLGLGVGEVARVLACSVAQIAFLRQGRTYVVKAPQRAEGDES